PRLMLSLVPGDSMPADGAWLAVQWFGPSNTLLASDSLWVDGGDPQTLVFELPADVTAVPGAWRAVVSLASVLLRQFRVDVIADPEEGRYRLGRCEAEEPELGGRFPAHGRRSG